MSNQHTEEFQLAFDRLMDLEGGLSDHPADRGGRTRFGISERWIEQAGLQGSVSIDDLTKDAAADLYWEHWWQEYSYQWFAASGCSEVGVKLLDVSVNMGPSQAHKILQRAINSAWAGLVLEDDGVLGPLTRKAYGRCRGSHAALLGVLLGSMRSEQAGVYRMIIARDPSQAVFEKGWLRRAYK